MSVEAAYRVLYLVVLLAFCIMIGIMLIRSVLTRGVCEKIVCVNMLSTMVICTIAILSRMLDEAYLLDVALIYAMISFIGVMYAVYLHLRLRRGWRGRSAAIFAVIGFIAVLFTYIGVNTLIPGMHSYG